MPVVSLRNFFTKVQNCFFRLQTEVFNVISMSSSGHFVRVISSSFESIPVVLVLAFLSSVVGSLLSFEEPLNFTTDPGSFFLTFY